MSDDHVLTRIAKDERIAWMTLNRPAKKNALSNQMMDKMIADIKAIGIDLASPGDLSKMDMSKKKKLMPFFVKA